MSNANEPRSSSKPYDKIAPHYDWIVNWLECWFLGSLRSKALHQVPANVRTLELGAGTGLNFAYYPDGVNGVASEPSTGMLRVARKKIRPPNVSLVQSCAESLPFENASFDAAFATLVFCSIATPDAAFAELRRVVKPGGSVVLLEHVRPQGLLGRLFDLLNLITVPLFEDHFNRRTATSAQLAGLTVLRVDESRLGIMNMIVCRV